MLGGGPGAGEDAGDRPAGAGGAAVYGREYDLVGLPADAVLDPDRAAQVNAVPVHAKHVMLAQPKTGLNFLVFAGSAGFRNLRINE